MNIHQFSELCRRRIEQFQSLSGFERRLFVRAIFWLPMTSALLRLLGFKRTLMLSHRGAPPNNGNAISSLQRQMALSAACMIHIAARHGLYEARCLPKSLVLIRFLRDLNIPASLKLGTRRQGDVFVAHAWVESGDLVVNDKADVELDFAAFDSPADKSA